MEPSSLLKAWPQKSHNIISAVIQRSKQLQAQQGLREEETHSPLNDGLPLWLSW